MDEIAAAIEDMRRIAMNVTGFHALAEDETLSLPPAKRMEYEAQVYAGGVQLAKIIARLDQLLKQAR